MDVILTAMDDELAHAWHEHCLATSGPGLDEVAVHQGSILEVACDAVVSPANSFGFMDGGIDLTYARHFGPDIQRAVQTIIYRDHFGELPVGNAAIVPTGDEAIPWLIAAPTMRVPMRATDTVHPYLAARAVLLLIRHGVFTSGPSAGRPIREVVQRVAFPGLGTGVGRVPAAICARQVRRAMDDVFRDPIDFPRTLAEASIRHQLLYTDQPGRLEG